MKIDFNSNRQAQIRAALSANTEMIAMYWDIGREVNFLELDNHKLEKVNKTE